MGLGRDATYEILPSVSTVWRASDGCGEQNYEENFKRKHARCTKGSGVLHVSCLKCSEWAYAACIGIEVCDLSARTYRSDGHVTAGGCNNTNAFVATVLCNARKGDAERKLRCFLGGEKRGEREILEATGQVFSDNAATSVRSSALLMHLEPAVLLPDPPCFSGGWLRTSWDYLNFASEDEDVIRGRPEWLIYSQACSQLVGWIGGVAPRGRNDALQTEYSEKIEDGCGTQGFIWPGEAPVSMQEHRF